MIYNCDWLQLFCDFRDWRMLPAYEYEPLNVSSNVFGNVFEVYSGREKLAMVAVEPKSPIIEPNKGLVKIINSALYRPDARLVVDKFLSDHHLIIDSISRVDICADFVAIGPYEDPAQLIRDVLEGKIYHVGRSKGQVSGKNGIVRRKGTEYAAIWRGKTLEVPVFEYLRYGKRSSNCATYMYDKTAEMEDVVFKPYIYNKWIRNGLDPANRHVWRLEFSLKPSALSLTAYGNSSLLSRWENYFDPWSLDVIFRNVAAKYFRFVDPATATRATRCKEIELFGPTDCIGELCEKEVTTSADRGYKQFLNKLHKVNDEIRTEQASVRLMAQYLLGHYAQDAALQDWAKKKGIDLQAIPTADDVKAALDAEMGGEE